MADDGAKETIYLFTTSGKGLYKRDLLNVCCFPDGWRIEFGYRKEYVREALRTDLDEKLVGHPAIIVFCEPVNENDTYYKYHPIRRGKIVSAKKDAADCITICFELGGLFNYTSADSEKRVNDFQDFVNQSNDRPQTLRSERLAKNQKVFVRSATATLTDDNWQTWGRHWHSSVAYLSQLKGLRDSFFIRIMESDKTSNHGRSFPRADLDGGGRPLWVVTAGDCYDVRFEIRAGPDAKAATLKVTARTEVINVLGPFERQSGEGTQIEFLIVPKRSFQADHSLFQVRFDPDEKGKSRSSEFGGVLEVRPRWALLPLTLILLVVGSVILSLDSVLMDHWVGKYDPNNASWWNGSVALWLAKAVGATLMGWGGFLGFRKLPLKS